jgi:hypothetical protein
VRSKTTSSQRADRPRGRAFVLAGLILAGTAASACGATRQVATGAETRLDHQPSPRIATPAQATSFRSITEAVRLLQAKVHVVLPRPLPPDTRLGPGRAVYVAKFGGRVNGQLHLEFGSHGVLDLQCGLAMFDGCGADAARPVHIGTRSALITTSPGSRWTQVIWPATPSSPEGRYGLAGTLPMKTALAMADSMEVERVRAMRAAVGC